MVMPFAPVFRRQALKPAGLLAKPKLSALLGHSVVPACCLCLPLSSPCHVPAPVSASFPCFSVCLNCLIIIFFSLTKGILPKFCVQLVMFWNQEMEETEPLCLIKRNISPSWPTFVWPRKPGLWCPLCSVSQWQLGLWMEYEEATCF